MQPANIADQDGMEASVPQWDQARIELISTWNEIQEKEQRMIQAGFINKVDPWLERTGWHRYLAGLDRHQLLHSIAKRDPDDDSNGETSDTISTVEAVQRVGRIGAQQSAVARDFDVHHPDAKGAHMKKPRVRIESTASPGMVPRGGISQFGGRREGREEEGEEQ
ncbi:MAG: hypothetical protein MMC33_010905 [Icmadophila ericetorum]|nr:hypothetical protein [Icmadophila ericetorum]